MYGACHGRVKRTLSLSLDSMNRQTVGRVMLFTTLFSMGNGKGRLIGIGWRNITDGDGEKLPIESLYSYPSLKRERKGGHFLTAK